MTNNTTGYCHCEWLPIDTAPKIPDASGITPQIILGFAPDEENYTLPSREGFWNVGLKCWVLSIDPDWDGHGQPTHWQPLPNPPLVRGINKEITGKHIRLDEGKIQRSGFSDGPTTPKPKIIPKGQSTTNKEQ